VPPLPPANWSSVGSDLSILEALRNYGNDLTVGRFFIFAASKISPYLAKVSLSLPFEFVCSGAPDGQAGGGPFSATLAGPAGSNAVIPLTTNLKTGPGSSPICFPADPSFLPTHRRLFSRVVLPRQPEIIRTTLAVSYENAQVDSNTAAVLRCLSQVCFTR